jgi:tetratricopeptide (TPR) repeat protein
VSESAISTRPRRPAYLRDGVLASLLVLAVLGGASYFLIPGFRDGTSPVTSAAAEINAKFAALGVQPHTVELTTEKALRLRAAIKQADFDSAMKIAASVLANSRVENWRFHPFGQFMDGVSDLADPSFKTNLDKWVASTPNSALPSLIRAQFYYDSGWATRGHNFSDKVDARNMTAFGESLVQALADVDQSIKLDETNPYGFYLRLRILQGLGAPRELEKTFQTAISKHPNNYAFYKIMLETYEPKWGGSIPAMYAFVQRYADAAPKYSPLKMLYLELYSGLLNAAWISCQAIPDYDDQKANCIKDAMGKIVTPDLESKTLDSFQLYDHTDKYQFGVFVEEILDDMLWTHGADLFSSIMLQGAADAMHSDTQLSEDKPHNNDYVIDALVGRSWYMKGFYDNALKKYQEALKDSAAMHFPADEEKDIALSNIYEWIADVYHDLNQYAELAAYEKAAIALRHRTNDEHYVCYGYYELKDYDSAIQACTETLRDQTGNLRAHYWRGRAYQEAGDTNTALKDLAIVAASDDAFHSTAAIDMSMIYFGRGDNRGALKVLNHYKYLYDPNLSSRGDAAVAYNNRCYALMQLGELRDALADCTASLKFGNIPDAYRKEQELLKRLASHQTGL